MYCPLNINFQAPSESDELTLVDVKSPTGIVYAWLGQIVTFFAYSLPSMVRVDGGDNQLAFTKGCKVTKERLTD